VLSPRAMTRRTLWQWTRSGLSGCTATVFDFAAMIACVEVLLLAYAPAAAIASAVGAVVCFAMNKWFAFRDSSPVTPKQIFGFAIIAGGAMALNAAFVPAIAAALGGAYIAAKAASAAVVFATWTYPTQSRVFSKRSLL